MNDSMKSAVKHYSSLFFLPPFRKTFAALALLCVGVVGLSTFVLFPSIEGLLNSLSLGATLLAVTLLCDYVTISLVLRGDPIFVWRRTAALSLFSWILWLGVIVPGAIGGAAFGFWLWVKLCLLGFAAVLTLRAVVFFSTSTAGPVRTALASLLQPFLCIIPFLVYWATINQINLFQVLPFLIVAPFLSLAAANFFVSLIDSLGRKSYNIPSLSLFKAFMLNWVEGLNAPLESYLERLGKDEDIQVSLLKFESAKIKAAIIVPLVHPGPFNNVGSSLLPSLLKHEFEKAFGGDACVPLGILGHELDLASQKQNQRIISSVSSFRKNGSVVIHACSQDD
jgi:predicted neutral ceramidase superfamily lipid hydrolase